jgi:hypothetical protein
MRLWLLHLYQFNKCLLQYGIENLAPSSQRSDRWLIEAF